MDITLINSEYASYDSLPYGFGIIIATLKKSNINTRIIDYNFLKRFGNININFSIYEVNNYLYQDILCEQMRYLFMKIADDIQTDIVCFSCFSFESLKQSLILAKYLKQTCPDKIIIFGGIGTSRYEKELMKEYSFIDFVIVQKGENQLCELIKCIHKNKSVDKISNMVYRNSNNEICSTNVQMHDIESQQCPDYDFYFNIKKEWALQYMTSDGCINNCAFCALTHNKMIYKSTKKVIKELKYLKSKYSVRSFNFQDDNINTNHKRTTELMNAMKKLDIEWYALSSANLMTEKIIKEMASAGCRWIQFGLESGSNKILKLMNKPVNLKKFEEVIKMCTLAGIKPQLNIIMGYPGETKKDVDKTLKYLNDNCNYYSHVNLMVFRLYFDSKIGTEYKGNYIHPDSLEDNVEKFNYFVNIDNYHNIDRYISFLEKHKIPYESVFKPKNDMC